MAFGFSKIWNGLKIKAKSVLTGDSVGDLEVSSVTGKLNYHNGTSSSPAVTEAHAATLTSKTIDASVNSISNISDTEIKAGAAIDATKIGAGTVNNTELGYLDGVTSPIQSQLNTISGSAVTSLTGDVTGTGPGATATTIGNGVITNAKVNASAAIDRSKLASGTANRVVVNDGSGVLSDAAAITPNRAVVSDANGIPTQSATSDTEIGYVAGVTSSIQTQLNNKQPLDATLTALAAFNSNGLVTQTAADTFTSRTLTGTANQVSVTNGDGVSGNPTVAIASNPVIPGTADIQIPAGTTAQRPGSPAAGMLRYNSDTAQFEGYSTAWGAIAGSGGSKNYITANDGVTTTGWATYADAAGQQPVDGTGGAAVISWATTSSSPLAGTSSFILTKPASNAQGNGVSYDFTIDSEDTASVARIAASIKVVSGTYADGDLAWYIVDTTTGQVIQPAPFRVLNAVGPYKIQPAEFQFNTGTTYRLCIHVASTSASAYVVMFDTFSVSPNATVVGAVVTDWTSTPAPSGTITNGTRSTWYWRRVGSNIEIECGVSYSGAGLLEYLATAILPSGLSIDTTKLSFANTSVTPVGKFYALDSGVADYTGTVYYNSSTLKFDLVNQTAALPFTPGSGDTAAFTITVPIQGWSTTQVLSSDTATNVVSAVVTGTPATWSANGIVIFPTVQKDSNGCYNASSGRYTVAVPGDYNVATFVNYNNGPGVISVYKNGSLFANVGQTPNSLGGGGAITVPNCVAGDILDVRASTSGGTPAASSVAFVRVSGPAQIAASEKVYLQYTGNGGQAITANTTDLTWSTKVVDSHSAWSGTAFVAPRAGWYDVKGGSVFNASIGAQMQIYVNGSAKVVMNQDNASDRRTFTGGTYLNAGDSLTVRSTVSGTLINSATQHWVAITSQG